MVPKLFKAGHSFKSLSAYLTHDANRTQSDARVRWTHTLNLAANNSALAVDEMLWTYRSAEDLKRDAGARIGGRPLKHPVRHFSLNWHPSETPTKDQMIGAVESFLGHMRWQDHQALIVCHDDKHPHVHVMLNAVHPITGRALDAAFEQRRAQAWAIDFEQRQGQIFCEERLKPVRDRQPSPTRDAWQAAKPAEREYSRAEVERVNRDFDYFKRNDDAKSSDNQWEAIKAFQRDQRKQFFLDGKEAYRDIRNKVFVEVRQEHKAQWREFYEAKRNGLEPMLLAAVRDGLVKRQREVLTERQDAAAKELRAARDETYKALLEHQKAERLELKRRQKAGLRDYDLVAPTPKQPLRNGKARKNEFRLAADELRVRRPKVRREQIAEVGLRVEKPPARVRRPLDVVGGVGLGGLGGIALIGERLFDSFFGGVPAPKPVAPPPDEAKAMFKLAQSAVEIQVKRESALTESEALKRWWDERRTRRRERD